MNLIQETKFIMNKYQVSANKSYGQNFLIDEDVVLGICEKANISKDDSKIAVYVVPTNEELLIARNTASLVKD